MTTFEDTLCDPDDELYDDDTIDVDEEYPRANDIEFLDQLFSLYEKYAREDAEDAMGS
tara:strand:- start:227 stop:400 length:174 start_codon:yes stop_codon:yes gene_type:complete